jgi:hypothetical protein
MLDAGAAALERLPGLPSSRRFPGGDIFRPDRREGIARRS